MAYYSIFAGVLSIELLKKFTENKKKVDVGLVESDITNK